MWVKEKYRRARWCTLAWEDDTAPRTERPTPMNRLFRSVLRLFAAPRINMREDYEKVRRLQRRVARVLAPRHRALDRQIVLSDDGRQIPIRVFRPREKRRDDLLVFFHGGGWVIGDNESYTPACVTMADMTGCTVASVDYRLAPEHPFPAGLDDCYRVVRLLLSDPMRADLDDPSKIVLIGESAGGNLAAAVSLLLAEEGHRGVSRQILLYPVTHWDHDPETSPFESVRLHGEKYRLTNAEVQDYLELYAPDPEQRHDRLVSPLAASDLSNQPRTLVVTAELDLLRDEGEAYGKALRRAGNDVVIRQVSNALHGFVSLPRFARPVRDAYEMINDFLDDTGQDDQAQGEGAT